MFFPSLKGYLHALCPLKSTRCFRLRKSCCLIRSGIIQKAVDLLIHITARICIRNFCHRKFFVSLDTFLIKILRNSDHIIPFPVIQLFLYLRNVIFYRNQMMQISKILCQRLCKTSSILIDNSNIQLFRLITCF